MNSTTLVVGHIRLAEGLVEQVDIAPLFVGLDDEMPGQSTQGVLKVPLLHEGRLSGREKSQA